MLFLMCRTVGKIIKWRWRIESLSRRPESNSFKTITGPSNLKPMGYVARHNGNSLTIKSAVEGSCRKSSRNKGGQLTVRLDVSNAPQLVSMLLMVAPHPTNESTLPVSRSPFGGAGHPRFEVSMQCVQIPARAFVPKQCNRLVGYETSVCSI